jgi:hypothetical protein
MAGILSIPLNSTCASIRSNTFDNYLKMIKYLCTHLETLAKLDKTVRPISNVILAIRNRQQK